MDRRRFLGCALAALTGGCTAPSEPSAFASFERRIRETGLSIKRITSDYRRWVLAYYPDRSTPTAFQSGVRTVAAAYADTVAGAAASHRLLECLLFDGEEERTGIYVVPADLARRYASGAIPEATYVERVLERAGPAERRHGGWSATRN